jgi:hypothetical protein
MHIAHPLKALQSNGHLRVRYERPQVEAIAEAA